MKQKTHSPIERRIFLLLAGITSAVMPQAQIASRQTTPASVSRQFERLLPVCAGAILFALTTASGGAQQSSNQYLYSDEHVHITNYIQEGTDIHAFLKIMGDKVERAALFGIPLQQEWSYANSGSNAPTYYLQTDARLYYYSFTDAAIAMMYKSLTKEEQARFDPMITGFNPADMYAADHIRRVLQIFPGVFEGIGEFTIHKEFVSSKVAGDTASLLNPALDRLLDFAGEVGLLVIIHSDMDVPFAKPGSQATYLSDSDLSFANPNTIPVYLEQMRAVLARHPKTTIIWAHTGLGRVVRPVHGHAAVLESILADPSFSHVYFDISWDEVAKYLVATPESLRVSADLINKYHDRFLFGSDEVAPKTQEEYLKVYRMYDPLWKLLTPEASEKVRRGNYERLFDQARVKVRAWEAANVKPTPVN